MCQTSVSICSYFSTIKILEEGHQRDLLEEAGQDGGHHHHEEGQINNQSHLISVSFLVNQDVNPYLSFCSCQPLVGVI